MFGRKRRGSFAQELGKTMGGVLASMGTFAFAKATFYSGRAAAQSDTAVTYSSTYVGGTGDLFAPFPPSQVHALMWIGLLMALGGTLLRIKSYWRIAAPEEEQ